ncbi:hypothetical protein D3C80_1317730 [compost metagenome]
MQMQYFKQHQRQNQEGSSNPLPEPFERFLCELVSHQSEHYRDDWRDGSDHTRHDFGAA